MKSVAMIVGILTLCAVLLFVGPWIWWHRIKDCERLNHGFAYCAIVWGSR